MVATVDRVGVNRAFLENIYRKGPFQGHAFCCQPRLTPGGGALGDYTLGDCPVGTWVPAFVERYQRAAEMADAVGDDNVPVCQLGTATHIYAAAFGCEVHAFAGSNPAALPRVRTAAEADALPEPDLWSSPTLVRVFEMARAVQSELGSDVPLGPPDMQSGFSTACLVWNKEDLLCAMMDPEEQGAVKRLAAKCARLFKRFLTELRREFPQMSPGNCPRVWVPPALGPWFSNDECGAFSPALFEEFCLPEILDLAATFGGIGMHCCAAAEHQFPHFARIPGFYAFNRVDAGQGFDPMLSHLGGPDGPVFVQGWMGPEQIAHCIESAPPGTRFIFTNWFDTHDEAHAWYEAMRKLSPRADAL